MWNIETAVAQLEVRIRSWPDLHYLTVKARCFETLAPTGASDEKASFVVTIGPTRDGRISYSGVFERDNRYQGNSTSKV